MTQGKMDLHIHTVYSDGEHTPDEIFNMVKKGGLEVFSITDHDTIEGAKRMTSKEGILYIPGIELTAKTSVGREHILGYDMDLENTRLNQVLRDKKQMDIENFLLYCEALKKVFGISFSNQEIDSITGKVGNIGRVDLSKLLRKYGYANSQNEAFQNYLNPIQELVRKRKKGLTEKECIHLIKEAGGYTSLAHSISLNPEFQKNNNLQSIYRELKERLLIMKEIGLDAIEIQHIYHDNPFREMLCSLAQELSLLESGGTDFHGESIKPGICIGSGYQNNVCIKKLSLVEEIRKRH